MLTQVCWPMWAGLRVLFSSCPFNHVHTLEECSSAATSKYSESSWPKKFVFSFPLQLSCASIHVHTQSGQVIINTFKCPIMLYKTLPQFWTQKHVSFLIFKRKLITFFHNSSSLLTFAYQVVYRTSSCKCFVNTCSLHYINMPFLIENADNLVSLKHSISLQYNIILYPSAVVEIIHQITPN